MKYTPSALVSQMSGKQGSTVASHNRFGSYFRNRTIPVNPVSPKQITNRNNMTLVAKAWSGLTPAQRSAWNSSAALVTLYDRLGRAYTPTGFGYFTSCNRNVFVRGPGDPLVNTPPSAVAPPALLTMTITATSV